MDKAECKEKAEVVNKSLSYIERALMHVPAECEEARDLLHDAHSNLIDGFYVELKEL